MGKNGASENGDNGDVVGLGEWELRRVKDGLDEAQVTAIINDLLSQRDALSQQTEHLSSLTRLAEKTVTEADRMAEEMKQEALEQAKTEATTIVTEAQGRAREIEDKSRIVQAELKNSVQGLYQHLLTELDNLKGKVTTLQAESEEKLSPLTEAVGEPTPAGELDTGANQESTYLSEAESPSPDNPDEAANRAEEAEEAEGAKEANLEFELEILPPIDIMRIMDIVTYLDSSPEVENTELIPNTDRPSIIVLLREPVDLVEMLRTLPEVASVNEVAVDEAEAEGKPRKIQIELAEKKVPQETT
jgi:vacuolar-type H+-ATPase subunit H